MAHHRKGLQMDSGNTSERPTSKTYYETDGSVQSVQTLSGGHSIELFFRDGYFIVRINGEERIEEPWLGIQLAEWNGHSPSWARERIAEYHPNDLSNYLKKKEERKNGRP